MTVKAIPKVPKKKAARTAVNMARVFCEVVSGIRRNSTIRNGRANEDQFIDPISQAMA
jgi:hypothetical protein